MSAINTNTVPSISFDIISRNGAKLGTIALSSSPGDKSFAVDVQFAMWDAGIVEVKNLSKLVRRDGTPGSVSYDIYVKGTRTPSFGLKQNVSKLAFGNVANMFKLENV